MQRSLATNVEVAERLGLTHSGVSRLRSGDRRASFDVMARIEKRLGWELSYQVNARRDGKWAEAFEAVLVKEYGAADVATATG